MFSAELDFSMKRISSPVQGWTRLADVNLICFAGKQMTIHELTPVCAITKILLYKTVALFLSTVNICNCVELHSKEQMLVDWHASQIVFASIIQPEEPAKKINRLDSNGATIQKNFCKY